MATTFKDVGNSLLELVNTSFGAAGDVLTAAGENARANAANNQATADANKAAPDIIKAQLEAQAARDKQLQDMLTYGGIGAGALIVILAILFLLKRKQ